LIFLFIFISLYIFFKILGRRKAVDEYIDDGVCLLLKFPPMADKEENLKELLADLYKDFFDNFKRKYYFSIEILITKEKTNLFIFIPRKLYKTIDQKWTRFCELDIVTKAREKFTEDLEDNVIYVDFETSKDFIYPLNVQKNRNFELSKDLLPYDLIFIQLCCRPAGNKWLQLLDSYIEDLKKGQDPSKSRTGFFSGFLRITMPVFTFLANFITFVIHGSGPSKIEINNVNEDLIKQDAIKKIELINRKRDLFGFEVNLKVCTKSDNKDRSYLLMDRILDIISYEGEELNGFLAEKINDKFTLSNKNNLVLANMEGSTIEIFNRDEVISLVNGFY